VDPVIDARRQPDQRALVKRAIETGRFTDEEQAVQEALTLREEGERRRLGILAAIDEAETSLAKGEGRPVTEGSMKALAVKEFAARSRCSSDGASSRQQQRHPREATFVYS
jgi:Arc/MetJ-type ribon-helix-helix transcriptional regulator